MLDHEAQDRGGARVVCSVAGTIAVMRYSLECARELIFYNMSRLRTFTWFEALLKPQDLVLALGPLLG